MDGRLTECTLPVLRRPSDTSPMDPLENSPPTSRFLEERCADAKLGLVGTVRRDAEVADD